MTSPLYLSFGEGKGEGPRPSEKKSPQRQPRREGRDGRCPLCLSGQLLSIRNHYWNSTGLLPELLAERKTPFEAANCWLEGRRESGLLTSGSTTGRGCSLILRSFFPAYSSSNTFYFNYYILFVLSLFFQWLAVEVAVRRSCKRADRAARQVVYVQFVNWGRLLLVFSLYFLTLGRNI